MPRPPRSAALRPSPPTCRTSRPAAFAYQGYAGNRAMFGITVERVSQAIVGELTVEEAVARMADDLAAAMSESKRTSGPRGDARGPI
jgi:alpha-1,4-digalacturonate transport system substrate-binding protein